MSALCPPRGGSRPERGLRARFTLTWLGDVVAGIAAMKLRPDMAEQLGEDGGRLPPGQKWSLTQDGELLAVGGLEPSGAGASLGWYLTADLTPRQWGMLRKASREVLARAATRGVKRVHALTPGARPEAAAMLARLGFKLTGQEGDDAVMTLELGGYPSPRGGSVLEPQKELI